MSKLISRSSIRADQARVVRRYDNVPYTFDCVVFTAFLHVSGTHGKSPESVVSKFMILERSEDAGLHGWIIGRRPPRQWQALIGWSAPIGMAPKAWEAWLVSNGLEKSAQELMTELKVWDAYKYLLNGHTRTSRA